MQQEPAPARSPGPQQNPVLPQAPTMPPPEPPTEGHQPSPSPSPTEVLLRLGRWGLGFVDLLWSEDGGRGGWVGENRWERTRKLGQVP